MTRRLVLLAAVTLVLGARIAWTHDGHVHKIMGTVTARDDRHLDVKTPGGEILSIAVNEKTSVVRGKAKVGVGEVRVGGRVVVDIGNGEDPLIAREIQLGAAAAAPKK